MFRKHKNKLQKYTDVVLLQISAQIFHAEGSDEEAAAGRNSGLSVVAVQLH